MLGAGEAATLGAAALAVFWMLGAYNRLVALRGAIAIAWSHVADALARRGEAVAPLAAALREPLPAEGAALDALLMAQAQLAMAASVLARGPTSVERASALVGAEAALSSAVARVLALLEANPQVQGDAAVAPFAAALLDGAPRLAFAREVFNEAVRSYNEAARQMPTRLLARLYGFKAAGTI